MEEKRRVLCERMEKEQENRTQSRVRNEGGRAARLQRIKTHGKMRRGKRIT